MQGAPEEPCAAGDEQGSVLCSASPGLGEVSPAQVGTRTPSDYGLFASVGFSKELHEVKAVGNWH